MPEDYISAILYKNIHYTGTTIFKKMQKKNKGCLLKEVRYFRSNANIRLFRKKDPDDGMAIRKVFFNKSFF